MNRERMTTIFTVDPSDYCGLLEIMDEFGDTDTMFAGENEDRESVNISVSHESIVVETFQENGWVRKNVYWRDETQEELFDGKWK